MYVGRWRDGGGWGWGSESGVHSNDGHRHPVGVIVSLHA